MEMDSLMVLLLLLSLLFEMLWMFYKASEGSIDNADPFQLRVS